MDEDRPGSTPERAHQSRLAFGCVSIDFPDCFEVFLFNYLRCLDFGCVSIGFPDCFEAVLFNQLRRLIVCKTCKTSRSPTDQLSRRHHRSVVGLYWNSLPFQQLPSGTVSTPSPGIEVVLSFSTKRTGRPVLVGSGWRGGGRAEGARRQGCCANHTQLLRPHW